MQGIDDEINCLDSHERNKDAAYSVDPQVAAEQCRRANRPILDAFQGERNECDDDQRIEDNRRQDRALRRGNCMTLSAPS